ncbi:hypothetical protein PIB30_104583 [Stylosanthes scabra]|uniref:Uncharacterized protein n=1 Tax=Stylosanthes scabra TaxID=79078 RepID=A0ABU6RYT9_9FABA|nr:hypothetical protein [Stylosanthes scabra]
MLDRMFLRGVGMLCQEFWGHLLSFLNLLQHSSYINQGLRKDGGFRRSQASSGLLFIRAPPAEASIVDLSFAVNPSKK